MPGKDQMGQRGQGSMTGRGMGSCEGPNEHGNDCQGGPGRGMGRGRGRGSQCGAGGGGRHRWRGSGQGSIATGLPGCVRSGFDQRGAESLAGEDEQRCLQRQAEMLREQLAKIENRLNRKVEVTAQEVP